MGLLKTSITQWADDDKPREKLILKGKASLSDAELLAILIGSGNRNETAVSLSQRILLQCQNNLGLLSKQSLQQLMTFNGIGEAKAVSIVAALELGRRRRMEEAILLPVIRSSQDVFDLMQPHIGDLGHEEFWVIFLNNSNKVVHKRRLSMGGITGTIVDIRILFKIALEYESVGIILCHNHPSGKLKASDEDKSLTKNVQSAAEILDINLLDHVIITDQGFLSFAEEELI
ncbi:RadC family protein [Myroides guanonis]|uniref:DNA repair protein RadC n=1 Tax=Myroides guanonis TaxID=1150112 RepID=A0A1I3M5W8_9FLAO|nr:DNA repair protein RadC [Myroides guanonis]SFI92348.1 DNA repair protein RadC [Myroides guanonis]